MTPYKIYGTSPPKYYKALLHQKVLRKNLKGIKMFYLWFSWLRLSSEMWCWQVTGILQKMYCLISQGQRVSQARFTSLAYT
jgi:hypothetical protein